MKDGGSRRRRPNKLKIVCSFNGEFQPRLPSGKLRYVGGEARIVSVERNIGFSRLKSKILELHRCTASDNNSISSFSLMYHLPCSKKSAVEEDSPLVLVTCDDDVTCMIEEYGKLEILGMDPRLWIFVCYDDNAFVKPNVLGTFSDLSRIAMFNGNSNGGYVRKDTVQAVYDNGCADDKVKKQTPISGSNRVKSGSNDSLRKIVLKQQLLANQSSKIVSSYTDPRLHIVKINGSYRCKYTGADILESEVFGNLGSLPASHSRPLNPTDFNVRIISNGSQQADLSLGNSSDCNLDESEGGQYLKSSCNPSMNRENIVPRGVDHGALQMRFPAAAISCPGKPGNGIVHGDIRTHGPDLRGTRNPRAFPYHFRSHRSAVMEMRNSKFNRFDGRSMVGRVGLRSASEVSKQGQTAAPCSLTWKLPSYYCIEQGEPVARAADFGLHNQKCSFNLQYGSQKNIIEQASPEGLQLGKLDLEGCHLPDQSLLQCDAVNNSSACTKILDGQIDLTHGLGSKQHEVQQDIVSNTLLQVSTNDEANNVINKPINVKDEQEIPSIFGLPISDDSNGGYKSFIQDRGSAHDFSFSDDISFHSLSVKPLCSSSDVDTDVSEACLTPQLKHLDIMDEQYFSSGPQVEKSSGTTCISSSHIMAEDNDEKPEDQQYLQYSVGIDEKDKIKKTNICIKINGGLHDADRAAFYTHLATKELQTINNSDLEYIKELGSGAYGTVFYGKWKGSDVAIKKLKPSRFSEDATDDDRLVADFWKEAYILGQLHHPNIVALYGVVADGPVSNFAVVTEYMVNGSLKQVLSRKDRTVDRRKRLIIALDAAFAMEYLHEKNIIHFDLKSHNFLVNMRDPLRPVCKIGDLGLSKIKQRTLVSGGVRGTIPWMAPELLNSKKMVNEKVDVYSFGIVMWELLTGEEPYANMKPKEIIAGIIENTLRPEIPSWCDPAWRSLMERCWSSDPDVRPSFSEIAKELRVMAASMNIK